MPKLSDVDRRALKLADDLQKALEQWLSYRGMHQPCPVSPFVDPAGEPAVIIKMNAQVASAMIDSLRQQRGRSPGQPGPGATPRYLPVYR
jgi:hypothetical protein